jgi:hypothetical protein
MSHKTVISTIGAIIFSLSLVSCAPINALSNTSDNASTNTSDNDNASTNTTIAGIANTKQTKKEKLKIGTVKKLVNGDLLCYVDIVDEKGKTHHLGASFEICAKENTYLNKKVRLTYEVANVSDCQSAEPCGKSRRETIISKMEIVQNNSNKLNSKDTQTITNGRWTITTGNSSSWSGVNGTGNFSYRGCDTKGKCINLTGGKATCRDAICTIAWVNGEYSYFLQDKISENTSTNSTTLIVMKSDKEILRETGFKIVK